MKKFFLLFSLLFMVISTRAQELKYVSFFNGSDLKSFSFRTDQDVIIKISADGKALEWGMESERYRYNYYPGKLEPYMGRVDYYGSEADTISKGKIKSIGTTSITYYPASETPAKAGKIKSIGTAWLDYYDNYENASFKGKLKSAGNVLFTYYSSFENESFAGKLKSAGNSPITYYSSFEDKLVRGKLKSIGSSIYQWYTSNSSTGYQGALKSGPITQVINGVTYIIM